MPTMFDDVSPTRPGPADRGRRKPRPRRDLAKAFHETAAVARTVLATTVNVAEPTGPQAVHLLGWILGAVEGNPEGPEGTSPPTWVKDPGIWVKAKTAARQGGYTGDTFWAVVAHIYEQMGGRVS